MKLYLIWLYLLAPVVPTASPSRFRSQLTTSVFSSEVVVIDVFENQEWQLGRSWGAPFWTDRSGSPSLPVGEISVPEDWEWASDWRLFRTNNNNDEASPDGEASGWLYATDLGVFSQHNYYDSPDVERFAPNLTYPYEFRFTLLTLRFILYLYSITGCQISSETWPTSSDCLPQCSSTLLRASGGGAELCGRSVQCPSPLASRAGAGGLWTMFLLDD